MKNLPILAACLFLFSCGKSYKITNDDLNWNPYKENDRLIFKSNTGVLDTVFVEKLERSKSKINVYSPFSGTNEQLIVLARHRIPYNLATGQTQIANDQPILALIAEKDGSMINLMLYLQQSIFPDGVYSIKELEKKPTITKTIGGKIYNDVIVLKPNKEYPDGASRYTDVLYWSKSKGYLRFDVNETEYWELISF